jgi:FixJ family two-component response regulator
MNPTMPVIALVENDLPANRAFARLLRAHGFTVEAFLSAELLLSRKSATSIDCLLLDVDLDGMSGIELQQLLRERRDATPIIFITGRDDPGARARAIEGGCSDFLCKPVQARVLVDAIGSAMAARPGSTPYKN